MEGVFVKGWKVLETVSGGEGVGEAGGEEDTTGTGTEVVDDLGGGLGFFIRGIYSYCNERARGKWLTLLVLRITVIVIICFRLCSIKPCEATLVSINKQHGNIQNHLLFSLDLTSIIPPNNLHNLKNRLRQYLPIP